MPQEGTQRKRMPILSDTWETQGNYRPQQVRNTEISEPSVITTTTIAPATPIDAYIQNLTTKGKSPEDILQTLKICYEDDGEEVAAATTFPDNEDF